MIGDDGELKKWKETMKSIDDKRFFAIMRLYLGEIKTPYNKENLLNELVAFLHAKENQKAVQSQLSPAEIRLLSAIEFYGPISESMLFRLLRRYFFNTILHTRLENLQDRLLVCQYGKNEFRISPVMRSAILPFLSKSQIVPTEKVDSPSVRPPRFLPHVIVAFLSYIRGTKSLLKNSGEFRKKSANELEKIFASSFPELPISVEIDNFSKCSLTALASLEYFIGGAVSLGLVRVDDGLETPDFDAWNEFAALSTVEQNAYLAAGCLCEEKKMAAATASLILSISRKYAGRSVEFANFSSLVGFAAYEMSSLHPVAKGRFEQIIANEKSRNAAFDSMLDFFEYEKWNTLLFMLIAFGFADYDEKKQVLEFAVMQEPPLSDGTDSASVESSYSFSLFAGGDLKSLLPLAKFADVRSCDLVSRYEISRQSCIAAFDLGMDADGVAAAISRISRHELPSSLAYLLREWNENYQSCSLFHGYVLTVSPEKAAILQNWSDRTKFRIKCLADGIFLIEDSEGIGEKDIVAELKNCGFDYLAGLKNIAPKKSASIFVSPPVLPAADDELKKMTIESESRGYIVKMLSKLEKTDLPAKTKQELKSLILQKTILNESQLNAAAVKSAASVVEAVNFSTKTQTLNEAVANRELVILTLSGDKQVVGVPHRVVQNLSDFLVVLIDHKSGARLEISLKNVLKVRKIERKILENLDLIT